MSENTSSNTLEVVASMFYQEPETKGLAYPPKTQLKCEFGIKSDNDMIIKLEGGRKAKVSKEKISVSPKSITKKDKELKANAKMKDIEKKAKSEGRLQPRQEGSDLEH